MTPAEAAATAREALKILRGDYHPNYAYENFAEIANDALAAVDVLEDAAQSGAQSPKEPATCAEVAKVLYDALNGIYCEELNGRICVLPEDAKEDGPREDRCCPACRKHWARAREALRRYDDLARVGRPLPDCADKATPAWTPENRRLANRNLLNALAALWDTVPGQRFGQLVMNLSREPGGFADTWEWRHGKWLDRIGEMHFGGSGAGGA